MKIQQLSVFLENQPGHLKGACRALADRGIDILALSLADTQQFGILRLIVGDWEAAKAALEAKGYVVKATEVVALEVEDRPGGLARVLDLVDEAKANVEYMYAFASRRGDRALLVLRFDDPAAAVERLAATGATLVGRAELFGGA